MFVIPSSSRWNSKQTMDIVPALKRIDKMLDLAGTLSTVCLVPLEYAIMRLNDDAAA